jgi:LCP family protein required for cell wall assembly
MSHADSARKPWARRARRPGLILTGALSALIALGSGSAFGYLVYLQSKIDAIQDIQTDDVIPDQPQNILVLGSDSREGLSEKEQQAKGDTKKVKGQRADTIILMRVDPRSGKTVVLHFPRDLRVPIHGTGQLNKINTAYEGPDGRQRMLETIRDFSGLPIHQYVEVNFNGFRDIVDAMGGVEICIDRPLVDEIAELYLPEPGCYQLGGKMALAFVRARNVEGHLIPDFSRIARQQQFLRAVLNAVLAPGSVLSLPRLAGSVIENLKVSKGISVIDINDIARELKGLGTPEVDFRVVPSTPVLIDEISYLEPIAELTKKLFSRLASGKPLGKVGLELALTTQYAQIPVRVVDAGGDAGLVETRLRAGGFDVLPGRTGTADATVVRYAPGRDAAATALARFLAGLFQFSSGVPTEQAGKGALGEAVVEVVVAPDFPDPVRRTA